MLSEPVVQIAYFADDAAAAARNMVERVGAGPFFLVERIQLAWGEHRGKPHKFLHSSAYGQWGDVMVEFVQQDEEGPSPFPGHVRARRKRHSSHGHDGGLSK